VRSRKGWPWQFRYLGAVTAVVMATMLRMAIRDTLGDKYPYTVFFASALFSGWYLGRGPGLVATVLGAVAADFFLTPPTLKLVWPHAAEWFGLLSYAFVGIWFTVIIDAHRRSEEQARRSAEALDSARERLRFHLENSPLALLETDGARRITQWSAGAERLFGWSAAEALGRPLDELRLVHEEDAAQVEAVMQDLMSGGSLRNANRNRNRRRDGTVIVCEWFNSVLLDSQGHPVSVLSLGLDVTARVRAEEDNLRLLENERAARAEAEAERRRASGVLESIRDGFLHLDSEWCFTYANERALELSRARRDELLGRSIWEAFPESVGTSFAEQLQKAAALRAPIQFELEYQPGKQWFDVHLYPSGDGISIYFSDITERKRLEERLRNTAKLESLGILAGGLAHDFNNLLVAVMGYSSLILGQMEEGSAAWRWAREVLDAAESAARLTRQMLAYAGKGLFVGERVDLSRLVEAMGGRLRALAAKADIDVDLAEDLPPVISDAAQIEQLILNLVANAVEASAPGGRISVATRVAEVDEAELRDAAGASGLRAGRYVVLEVRDSGCGMDDETRARIFDPFYTTKFIGRGLGLAAALGIARAHQGGILVRSAPGKGSTFLVIFPPAAATGAAAGGSL
jgi:two-component system, cell cycle sensor histidine kinase and response regulator CckA